MNSVSATMIQEKARPTKVLTLSTNKRTFCIHSLPGRLGRPKNKHHPAMLPDGVCPRLARGLRSGLLAAARLLAEVVVVRSLAAHVVVEVPLDGALGELLLRGDDLVEHRVVRAR